MDRDKSAKRTGQSTAINQIQREKTGPNAPLVARKGASLSRPKSVSDAVDGSSAGTCVPQMWVLLRPHVSEEPSMQTITTARRSSALWLGSCCSRRIIGLAQEADS